MALTPTFLGAHPGLGTLSPGSRPAGVVLALTSVAPTTVPLGQATAMTLTGAGFKSGAVVRYWDGAGVFQGVHLPDSLTATSIVVTVNTGGWQAGTGGVDVYLDGAQTEQKHFTIS